MLRWGRSRCQRRGCRRWGRNCQGQCRGNCRVNVGVADSGPPLRARFAPCNDQRGPRCFPQVLFAGRPGRQPLKKRQLAVVVAVSDALPTVATIEIPGMVLSELPVSRLELTSTAPVDEVTRARSAALRARQRQAQRHAATAHELTSQQAQRRATTAHDLTSPNTAPALAAAGTPVPRRLLTAAEVRDLIQSVSTSAVWRPRFIWCTNGGQIPT